MTRIINSTKEIVIQPRDIDTTKWFMEAFDHMETEISARWVVRFCKELGGWVPFSTDQIQKFYTSPGNRPVGETFCFNRLIHPGRAFDHDGPHSVGGGWIVVGEDGLLRVTDDFVLRCYKASPVV